MASLSPLQLALKSAYESGTDNVNVQQNMLNHLGDGCFYLQDFEMDLVEIPYLVKFLQSKTAIKEIKSVELVLKPGVAPEQRRRKPTVHAKQVTKQGENNNNRLLVAVFDFIKNSHGLELVMLDNVTFTSDQLTKLSEAMCAMHSNLNKVAITNCPIGSTGLRILTPAINKHHSITQVVVKGCGLTDDSASFLTAILKASVAHMDQLYWNSTLRMSDPIDGSLDSSTSGAVVNEETNHVFSSGLVALDVSDNELTSSALDILSRQLKNNHWLLALDLSGNKIEESGLLSLAETLSTGENSALGIILTRGNPGFGKAACDKLQDVTDAASDRLECMPADLYEILKDLDTLRLEETASANGVASERSDRDAVEGDGYDISEGREAAGMVAPRPKGIGGGRVDRPLSAGSGRGIGVSREMEMDMEFSIPTPVDGDTTTFQGSPTPDLDPASSPAALLSEDSVRSASDSGVDGRPISRGSLRPRPSSGGGARIFSPSSNLSDAAVSAGGVSNRRKVNRGTVPRSVSAGTGTGAGARTGEDSALSGIGRLDSVDLLRGPGLAVDHGAMTMAASFESGMAWGPGGGMPPRAPPAGSGITPSSSARASINEERKPFYPGGTGRAYQNARDGLTPNPRVRAANYAEQVRMMQLCMSPPSPPQPRPRRKKKGGAKAYSSSVVVMNADVANTTAGKTKNATAQTTSTLPSKAAPRVRVRSTSPGITKTDKKLEQLTGAVERVTKQLEITAERITNLSDSLSESVVNLSLNSSRLHNTSATADLTSGSVESGASAGRKKATSTQHKANDNSLSPSRYASLSTKDPTSSLADVVEAPSPMKGGEETERTSSEESAARGAGANGASKQSQRNSPGSSPSTSPSRTKNRDKDVSRVIRTSMREKLDKYLDELQF